MTPDESGYLPNILIVGPSGSGKSTAYENLLLKHPDETAVIETELKGLPFKVKPKKITYVESWDQFEPAVQKYKADKEVKYIVIDSISKHLERCLQFCRISQKNYDIWTLYGKIGTTMFGLMHSKDKIIICTSLDELVEGETVGPDGIAMKTYKRMAATMMGNELRGKVDKEFTIVVHTDMRLKKANGAIDHRFLIKPDGITTAKTPRAMFGEQMFIPNDVKLIIDEMNKI